MHRSESRRHGNRLYQVTFFLIIILIFPSISFHSQGNPPFPEAVRTGPVTDPFEPLSDESSNITISDRYLNVSVGPGRTQEQEIWIKNDQTLDVDFIISNRSTLDKRILVYTEYSDNSANGEYQNTMKAINMTTIGYEKTTFNDADRLSKHLRDHDILLVPEQETADQNTLKYIGMSWNSTLKDFMNRGGAVVFCYNTYYIAQGAGLLSFSTQVSETNSYATVVDTGSPLVKNVNSTFMLPNAAISLVTTETLQVVKSGTNPVVIDKSIGAGDLIFIGVDYYDIISSPDSNKILGNAMLNYGGSPLPGWIYLSEVNGTIGSGATRSLKVRFDTTHLQPGHYSTNLSIFIRGNENTTMNVSVNMVVPVVDRDLRACSISIPPYTKTGVPIRVDARISNQGKINATNVGVYLNINGSRVQTHVISSLHGETSWNISFLQSVWSPGQKELEIEVEPMSGEAGLLNNVVNTTSFFHEDPDLWLDREWINLSSRAGRSTGTNLTVTDRGMKDLHVRITDQEAPFLEILMLDGSKYGMNPLNDILEEKGWTVTQGGKPSLYTGTPDPDDFDCVILAVGDDHNMDMPDEGQTVIADHVRTGGGIFTTEWATYHVQSGRYQILEPIMSLSRYNGGFSELTLSTNTSHFIGRGTNDTIELTPTYFSSCIPAEGASSILTGDECGTFMACMEVSSGRSVNIGTPGYYDGFDYWTDENLQRLVIRSIIWASSRDSFAGWLDASPDNFSLIRNGTFAVNVTASAARLDPGTYRNNLTMVTNDPLRRLHRVPVNFIVEPDDHDLRLAEIDVLNPVEAGVNVGLNITVINQGRFTEPGVELEVYSNGVIYSRTDIGSIPKMSRAVVRLDWSARFAGRQFIVVRAVPVSGETLTWNNDANITITAVADPHLICDQDLIEFRIQKGAQQTRYLNMTNTGLAPLNYRMWIEEVRKTGNHHTEEGIEDIDLNFSYDHDGNGEPDIFERIELDVSSGDHDSIFVMIEGTNSTGTYLLYSSTGSDRKILLEDLFDLGYTMIDLLVDDTENNDLLDLYYNFSILTGKDWVNLENDRGIVGPLETWNAPITADGRIMIPGNYEVALHLISDDLNTPEKEIRLKATVISHDLKVRGIHCPDSVDYGKAVTVTGEVFNNGTEDERDITVRFIVGGVVLLSNMIETLEVGGTRVLRFIWVPEEIGTRELSVRVEPVPYEVYTLDNSATVTVLSIDDQPPVADAGDNRTAVLGEDVICDGSGSTDNHMIANSTWYYNYLGEEMVLEGMKIVINLSLIGNYLITLKVKDPSGNFDTDSFRLKVVEDLSGPEVVLLNMDRLVEANDLLPVSASIEDISGVSRADLHVQGSSPEPDVIRMSRKHGTIWECVVPPRWYTGDIVITIHSEDSLDNRAVSGPVAVQVTVPSELPIVENHTFGSEGPYSFEVSIKVRFNLPLSMDNINVRYIMPGGHIGQFDVQAVDDFSIALGSIIGEGATSGLYTVYFIDLRDRYQRKVGEVSNISFEIDTDIPVLTSPVTNLEKLGLGRVPLTLRFNENMDRGSDPLLYLSRQGSTVGAQGSWLSENLWVGYASITEDLEEGNYSIMVHGARDLAGNEIFHLKVSDIWVDTVRPRVLSVEEERTGSGSHMFTVSFSEIMDDTEPGDLIHLSAEDGEVDLSEFTWVDAYTLTFKTTDEIEGKKEYVLLIDREVSDTAGNGLVSSYQLELDLGREKEPGLLARSLPFFGTVGGFIFSLFLVALLLVAEGMVLKMYLSRSEYDKSGGGRGLHAEVDEEEFGDLEDEEDYEDEEEHEEEDDELFDDGEDPEEEEYPYEDYIDDDEDLEGYVFNTHLFDDDDELFDDEDEEEWDSA